MQRFFYLAAGLVSVSLLLGNSARADCDQCDGAAACSSCESGGCSNGGCGIGGCGIGGCGKCGRHARKYIEGQDLWFNCGCNGSYKFPVPPLSTYHWPGMFQRHLMTDYHSPWRFPPLRPYVDEDQPAPLVGVQQVSSETPVVAPRSLKMSERMRSLYR